MKKPEGEIPPHTWRNDCFGNLTTGVLSDLNSKEITVTHTLIVKHTRRLKVRLIHQRAIWAGQQSYAASSLRFTLFVLCCFRVNLLCFHSVIFLARGCSHIDADLFCTVLQRDDRCVLSWAAEQCREQSRLESKVASLFKSNPSRHWYAQVVCSETKFAQCQ